MNNIGASAYLCGTPQMTSETGELLLPKRHL